jgi:hypothetical protein
MLLAWLLPDASHPELFEGWDRPPYLPRHGKPPLPVGMARWAVAAIAAARDRNLSTDGNDGLPEATRPASLAPRRDARELADERGC